MNSTSKPIGLFDKLNASVLLAVTPEYGKIKAARREGAGRISPSSRPQVMQPEYRSIAGVKVRVAEGGQTRRSCGVASEPSAAEHSLL